MRRAFGCFVAVALAAAVGCDRPRPVAEAVAAIEPGTNVVLVVVDTLRADWTTPYGFEQDTTPELARWAAEGIVFERALAQSSWTKMSMASLMTSLWPRSHGIRLAEDGLGSGALTLAEVLSDAGYRAYGVQSNGWLHQSFGFHQGFDRYSFPFGSGALLPRSNVWPHADRILAEAERLLDAHPDDEPFFLYLHFMDVHEYAAPPEFQLYGPERKGAYLSSIRWTDDALERLREMLDDRGHLDETLIVLGSDHGETFGEDGYFGHARNVLSASLHVPLVIRLPDAIEPVRVPSAVRNLDIAPTILDLLKIPVPDTFEGRSLTPLFEAADDASPPSFAALGQPLYTDASVQHSTTDGIWTYARDVEPDPEPGEQLFDRTIDPQENVDLSGREPAMLETYRARMDDHLAEGAREGVLEDDVRIDPEIAERLRAMGYLQ